MDSETLGQGSIPGSDPDGQPTPSRLTGRKPTLTSRTASGGRPPEAVLFMHYGLRRVWLIERTRPPLNVSSTIQSPLEYTNRFAPKMGQNG